MGAFIALFILFLLGSAPCFDSSDVHVSLCVHRYTCNAAHKQQLRHFKFLSQRIPYYCNSSSTFQLRLLISGDVDPNPGPGPVGSDLSKPTSTQSRLVSYNRDELFQLKHAPNSIVSNQSLHPSILDHMKYLGILQNPSKKRLTHRGKKGGTRRLKNLPRSSLPAYPHCGPTNTGHRLAKPNAQRLRFALWNAHSINAKDKSTSLCDFVISHQLDVLAVTETWLTGDDRDHRTIADINNTLPNYVFRHSPRLHSRAGGVGILVRNGINIKLHENHAFKSFEHIDLTLSSLSSSFRLLIIYRPPPNKKNKLTFSMFLEEFGNLAESVISNSSKFLLAGDFNIHVDSVENREAANFCDLLAATDLIQHVNVPTHDAGHTLDLLISDNSDDFLSSVTTNHDLPSDHAAVKCLINVIRPPAQRSTFRTRKIRSIDLPSFKLDILDSPLLTNPSDKLDSLVLQYDSTLQGLLDHHAPEVERSVILRPHAPWYSDTLRDAKQEKRRLERKWQKSGLTVHKDLYRQQCATYRNLLNSAKSNYHCCQIAQCDQRNLFRIIDNLCHAKQSDITLPHAEDPKNLADKFAAFFDEKIVKLHDRISMSDHSPISVEIHENCSTSFTEFCDVTPDEVLKLIKQAPVTSCKLDPLPSSLFKDNLPELLPILTKIVNLSLSTGSFPDHLKEACVLPLLKKPSLDPDDMTNYRPISNLRFTSKLIERAAMSQLQTYLCENSLHAEMQSAYRPHHSTETALLRVQNDILLALDQRKEAVLVLLDFSAAFDIIDHIHLRHRLSSRYGIKGTVLKWFSSYLNNRKQSVLIDNVKSDYHHVWCGVPQGSVAGPLEFIMFSAPLQDLISAHGVSSVAYADDTQLYITFDPADRSSAVSKIEACIKDIKSWAVLNKLVLNDSKTDIIFFGSRSPTSLPLPNFQIGHSMITPSPVSKNLGVFMDSSLNMRKHVDHVCKTSLMAIRKISKIRRYLDYATTTRLVHAFVTSRLDSCNSLLFGLPAKDIAKLQRVQNIAARLIFRVPPSQHISPILQELHWLPITARIAYKINLLTYKSYNGLSPTYLSDLLQHYVPARTLRSSNQSLLQIPKISSKAYGQRSFSFAASSLWNNLPHQIRKADNVNIFKTMLKTHLFKSVYS